MKNEYCLKRDRLLSRVIEGLALIYFGSIISYTFLIAPLLGLEKDGIWLTIISYVLMVWWMIMCEKHKYCWEASLMLLSTVFFFLECIFKLPFWILVRGFKGAADIFISRLRRFIKLESYRFKKHP